MKQNPNGSSLLTGNLKQYTDIFSDFWDTYYGTGSGSTQDESDIQTRNDKVIKNQVYESKGTQPRKIFSMSHPYVTHISIKCY